MSADVVIAVDAFSSSPGETPGFMKTRNRNRQGGQCQVRKPGAPRFQLISPGGLRAFSCYVFDYDYEHEHEHEQEHEIRRTDVKAARHGS
jgi:hypothetical protein